MYLIGDTSLEERQHAEDCAACDTKQGTLDPIDAEISLIGDLSEDQRQRLMEIADRCPVHRTLVSEIQIRTTLTLAGAATSGELG